MRALCPRRARKPPTRGVTDLYAPDVVQGKDAANITSTTRCPKYKAGFYLDYQFVSGPCGFAANPFKSYNSTVQDILPTKSSRFSGQQIKPTATHCIANM